jgi:hypothetical protein
MLTPGNPLPSALYTLPPMSARLLQSGSLRVTLYRRPPTGATGVGFEAGLVGGGEGVGVGGSGEVGVAGGTGVAVGAIGVDTSECGVGVSIGVSVGKGVEPVTVVSASAVGVKVSRAMTFVPLPFMKVETAA